MEKQKRVLVVDDERGIRMLLSEALSKKGFQVTQAEDGQESLDRLGESRFDLVITDIDMPKVDGLEMLRRMKKAGREEKVIVMTGSPGRFSGQDLPKVMTHLEKPFGIDHLLDAVIAATASSRKGSRVGA
jgi:DNA-binding NtrC family response regulator